MKQERILNDNIKYLFLKFCIPSILGMLGISLYVLADTFFVANGVGELGLAALNIVLPIYSLISATGLLLGIGGAAYASVESAKGNKKIGENIYSFTIIIGLLIGGIFSLLGLIYPYRIVSLLGASENTIGFAVEYIRVIMCFAPMFILNNIFLAFVRNDGKPKLAMISMIVGSLFNVVMDYVSIYIWGLGMFGAALATGASPVIGIIIMSLHLFSKKSSYKLKISKFKLSLIKSVLSGGGASFIAEISPGVVMFIFNQIIFSIDGDMGIAAFGIIANISLIINGVFTGIAQGIQPIVSVNYGANKINRIKEVMFLGVISAILIGVTSYILGVHFAEEITLLFNKSRNLVLQSLTVDGINLYFLGFILMGVNLVIAAFFQSVLHMRESTIISIFRGLLIVVISAFILSKLIGISGVWISPFISEVITIIIAGILIWDWFRKKSLENN